MTEAMDTFLLVVACAAVGGWVLFALARVQTAWDTSQRKTTEMRRAFTAAGMTLLRDVETIQKLDDEIKRVKDGISKAISDQQDRHQALAKSARPPPPDTYVTSEYPPSQKELAWLVTFMRDPRVPQQSEEREPKPMLIWGHTQSAALQRARQLIQDHKAYVVGNVGPFHIT
jgi:hypothetical protein